MARRIVLQSPLTPAKIAEKLRDVLGDRDDAPKAGVSGQGDETTMTLFVYRPNLRNSFETQLVATMTAEGEGTRIEGKLGPARGSGLFLGCWFGFLTLFLAIVAAGVAATDHPDPETWPMVAIPLAMMGFGWALWRLGTWNALKDSIAILAFLERTVEARAP